MDRFHFHNIFQRIEPSAFLLSNFFSAAAGVAFVPRLPRLERFPLAAEPRSAPPSAADKHLHKVGLLSSSTQKFTKLPSLPPTPKHHPPCSFSYVTVSQSPRLTRLLTVMDREMLTGGWLEYFQQCFTSTLDGSEETAFVTQIQTEKLSVLILGTPPYPPIF